MPGQSNERQLGSQSSDQQLDECAQFRRFLGAALVERPMPRDYNARCDQAIMFSVKAWDANCPRHIPRRLDADAVHVAIEERDQRIAELEAEITELKAARIAAGKS